MTYSSLSDIEDRLPFTVNANSIPKNTQLTGIQRQANNFINGYIGRNSDLTSNTGALATIETDISVNYAMMWVKGYAPYFEFTESQKVILDNYRSDTMVYLGKMNFDDS